MLKIIPLGGIGHVTNNMYVYELEHEGRTERLIVDCGIGFPEEEMLGADLLVPDITYLKDKADTIVGCVLTHGHDDHIAALPYVLPQLNATFPIYASRLTAGFAQGNLDEFDLKIKIQNYPDSPLQLGSFTIDPVNVTHSVPDTKHLVIKTPSGTIYHGSDFKLDWTPIDGIRPDLQKMAAYAREGLDGLLIDCLRVEKTGYSLSEKSVGESLERELRDIKGKVIITTMSSNIHRIQQALDAAKLHGRQVAFIGRSVEDNTKVAQQLGFLNIPQGLVINKKRAKTLPPHKQCLVVAGSQGQIGSTLTRISQDEHTLVSVKPGDHIVFSADPIPGNEANVYRTIDDLARLGATVSYSEVQDDLHVSGHASSGELRMMLSLLKPQNIVPIGGTYRHMNQFKVLAEGMGWQENQIILPKGGEVIAFDHQKAFIDSRIKLKTVIVDGLGVGDIGPAVLSDRKKMAQSGMVIVAVPVGKQDNKVVSRPEVITRGFVFIRTSQKLLEDVADEVSTILPEGMLIKDWKQMQEDVQKHLQGFLFKVTQRDPLILVVLVKS